jgi:hypothetical protein
MTTPAMVSKDTICSLHSSERVSTLTPEILAKRWGIGLEASKSTLQATTQAGIRNVFAPGKRKLRFRTDHLKYPHLKTTMYTDTMFARVPAIGGKKASQVYTNGSGNDFFFPVEKREKAITTIQTLVEGIGAPQTLVSDGAGELRSKEWKAECRRLGIVSKVTVPHSPWQNLAEASIREFKKNVRRHMRRSGSPRKFWDYCGIWCAAIRRLTSMAKLDNRTPTEVVTGTTPDISQYALFDWYEPVRQWDVKADFPDERKILGRFLGVVEHCTEEMSFIILSANGKVTLKKSAWAIPPDERRSDKFKEELKAFDAAVAKIHGDGVAFNPALPEHIQDTSIFENDNDVDEPVEPNGPDLVRPELDQFSDISHEAYDNYLNAQIKRAKGDQLHQGTVVGRVRDHNGNPVG